MNKSKAPPKSGKTEVSIVRSSAAEYLTFVAAAGQGGVEAVFADENVWLTQKMMGQLYDVDVRTINYHLKKVFNDSELEAISVIRNFRITAADGKNYNTQHYNLTAIIAVGYKVNSERAVQFRKWATGIIESFTIKGFAMDDERLKNDGSVLTKRYFAQKLPKRTPKANSRNTASCRTGCSRAILTGCSGRLVTMGSLRVTGNEGSGYQGSQAVTVVLWRESARS